MTSIKLNRAPAIYKNKGQQAQVDYIYTMTGEVTKADNKPYTLGGDYEGTQIKSARASVCKGTDIERHVEEDGATEYAYVTEDRTAYIMNPFEYIEFVKTFATITRESDKNGGQVKLRLKSEGQSMLRYLAARV